MAQIGIYTVTLSVTITFQESYEPASPTLTVSDEIEFELRVNPCFVNSYTVSSALISPVSYSLQDPEMTFGPYSFEQSPDCGYDETVTIGNLPTFVTHNLESKDFTIAQTSNTSLVGVFNIIIRSTFEQPDILGDTTTVH